nr:hypothetical protein [Treponema sp.]
VTPADVAEKESGGKEMTQMKEFPARWNAILAKLGDEAKTIPEMGEATGFDLQDLTFQVMTMVKYRVLEPAGIDDDDEYYSYKRKR